MFTEFAYHVRTLEPRLAVVLGSGLGGLPFHYNEVAAVPFQLAPNLYQSTITGHSSQISVGATRGSPILIFRGRLHFYEGHPWERVGMPMMLAQRLGIRAVLLTNAAGGIHSDLAPGSLMMLRDHLSWRTPTDWKAPGPVGCSSPSGERASVYSERLRAELLRVATEAGLALPTGVYAAVTGPCYETPAEIRALRAAGADAVGMSTAHEAETAASLGLEIAAISLITNWGAGITNETISHEHVLQIGEQSKANLSILIEGLAKSLKAASAGESAGERL